MKPLLIAIVAFGLLLSCQADLESKVIENARDIETGVQGVLLSLGYEDAEVFIVTHYDLGRPRTAENLRSVVYSNRGPLGPPPSQDESVPEVYREMSETGYFRDKSATLNYSDEHFHPNLGLLHYSLVVIVSEEEPRKLDRLQEILTNGVLSEIRFDNLELVNRLDFLPVEEQN
jgi:hypothetical protein